MKLNRRIADIIFTVFLFAVALVMVLQSLEWPLGARLFPLVVGGLMAVLLALQLRKSVARLRRESAEQSRAEFWPDIEPAVARRRAATMVLVFIGFALLMWLLGFPLGGTLATVLYLKLIARERWSLTLAIGAGTMVFFWATRVLLTIPYPEPALPFVPPLF